MIDRYTIAFWRNTTLSILLGFILFGVIVAFLLMICTLVLDLVLYLLRVVSSISHEIVRIYDLQPSLLQLVLLVGGLVLGVWFLARCYALLLKALTFVKDTHIDASFRRAYDRAKGGRYYGR